MDVFSSVVMPAHDLARVFDVILSTADEHELRKLNGFVCAPLIKALVQEQPQ